MGIRERSAIGKRCKKKLIKNPMIERFNKNEIDIFFLRNFLSSSECISLKETIKSDMTRSGTLGESYSIISEFRTSSTSYFNQTNNIVDSIDRRIADVLGVDPETGESMQGQHYTIGQTFQAHCDFFHEGWKHWSEARREGGQRVWTAMAYLDDDMEGGETKFAKLGMNIKPLAGLLVMWNNLTDAGQPNWKMLHEGAPVTRGEKTILTKWYRERTWKGTKCK